MALVSVVVDSRESPEVKALTFGGVDKSIAELPAGDLMALCHDDQMLLVERKSPSDFLHTLRQNRLTPQLHRMREQTPWSYLVVTEPWRITAAGKVIAGDRGPTEWDWTALQGALLTCQEIGVAVVYCRDADDYEGTIERLSNRDRSTLRVQPARDTALLSEGEQILTALPGIGPVAAEKLMGKCGSAAYALTYLSDDQGTVDLKVEGVGPAAKKKARRALGLKGDQLLLIIEREATLPRDAAGVAVVTHGA